MPSGGTRVTRAANERTSSSGGHTNEGLASSQHTNPRFLIGWLYFVSGSSVTSTYRFVFKYARAASCSTPAVSWS